MRTEAERIELYAGFDEFCLRQQARLIRDLNLQRGTIKHKPLDAIDVRREGEIDRRGVCPKSSYQGAAHGSQT
jgi:hypothetical protein